MHIRYYLSEPLASTPRREGVSTVMVRGQHCYQDFRGLYYQGYSLLDEVPKALRPISFVSILLKLDGWTGPQRGEYRRGKARGVVDINEVHVTAPTALSAKRLLSDIMAGRIKPHRSWTLNPPEREEKISKKVGFN